MGDSYTYLDVYIHTVLVYHTISYIDEVSLFWFIILKILITVWIKIKHNLWTNMAPKLLKNK